MSDSYEGWAVVEIMGHKKTAGYVRQSDQFGVAMIRIDVPAAGEYPAMTQFFNPSALFSLNPTTEEICRSLVEQGHFRAPPVSVYDLPQRKPVAALPGPAERPDDDDEIPFDGPGEYRDDKDGY